MKTVRMITATVLAALLLAGCGFGQELTGGAPDSPPPLVTVVVLDISGSTLPRRDAYLSDAMTAITGTAELGGAVYVSTVDGLATDDSWQIADRRFTTSVGGNQALARAARRRKAQRLRPRIARLLQGRGQGGSDLLAALGNVRRLLCTLAAVPERRVVIISDGAVNAGDVNLYRQPPRSDVARARLVDHLRGAGEIPPNLGCGGRPVRVWLSQLGAGMSDRATALAVRSFFVAAVESTGAVVVAEGPQLLPGSFTGADSGSRATTGGGS